MDSLASATAAEVSNVASAATLVTVNLAAAEVEADRVAADASAAAALISQNAAAVSAAAALVSKNVALTSQNAAAASDAAAAISAITATTQAGVSTTQASAAATSAAASLVSQNAAATSATTATTQASAATTSAAAAAASYDSFDDRYLGTKTSNPTLDNDGQALLVGALYFNTVTAEMRVWTGTLWQFAMAGSIVPQLFSGTGSQVNFTLSAAPLSKNNTQVEVFGVYQQKDTYSLAGSVLTFSEAPPAGTNNIEVLTVSTLALGTGSAGTTVFTPTGTITATDVQAAIVEVISDLSASSGSDLVGHIAAGAGAVATTVQAKLRETVSVKDFGAVGDGATDDTAAIQAATSAADGVFYPSGTYIGDTLYNLYDATVNENRKALFGRLQSGTNSVPTADRAPVLWVQKTSSCGDPSDQGAIYGSSIKMSGAAYSHAVSGFALALGGSGDAIGIHGRVQINNTLSNAYAGWFYVNNKNSTTDKAWHAIELNGNTVKDAGYGGFGQLLRICMADSASSVNRASSAITIGKTTTGGNNGFYTGIHIERDSVIQSAGATDDNEAMRIDTPIGSSGGIGGIRFAKGNVADTGLFKFAIRTDEVSFVGNTVFLLGNSQYIRWGTTSSPAWIAGAADNLLYAGSTLNITPEPSIPNQALRVNNTAVVGTRKTGWGTISGSAVRSGFTTSATTVEQVAQHLKALIDDLKTHGLIGA